MVLTVIFYITKPSLYTLQNMVVSTTI